MAFKPIGNTFVERVMQQMFLQKSCFPVRHVLLIDLSLDRHMSHPNQPAEPRGVAAAAAEPPFEPIILSPHMKHADRLISCLDSRSHLSPELGGDPFVSIHHEHPRMLIQHLIQPGISLGGVVVEPPLHDTRTQLFRDLDRPVAAEGIQHDDVV